MMAARTRHFLTKGQRKQEFREVTIEQRGNAPRSTPPSSCGSTLASIFVRQPDFDVESVLDGRRLEDSRPVEVLLQQRRCSAGRQVSQSRRQ